MRGWQVVSGQWQVVVLAVAMLVLMMAMPFLALAQEAAVSAAPAASVDYLTVIAVAALAVSEALALIPQLKSNGLLHMVILTLKKMLGRPVVPVVLLAVMAAGLSGCSTFNSVAPTFCTFATSAEAQAAALSLATKLPEGTDKQKVMTALSLADLSADAACTAIKAIEAQKLAAAK